MATEPDKEMEASHEAISQDTNNNEVLQDQNEVVDLKVGMEVKDDEAAYKLYAKYGMSKGFSIRKHKPLYKGKTKLLRGYKLVCSREGKTEFSSLPEEVKAKRLNTRTECKASVTFEEKGDKWVITELNCEHNHPFVPPEQRRFMRSARKLTDASKDIIQKMTGVGIKPTKAYAFLAKEVGGIQNMEFTESDCHNFLQAQRSNFIGPGDAQSLINYFKSKLAEDPMFFHHETFDEQGRLSNIFWIDGASRIDYDIHGDVLVFDTTYRTNKYNMVCAPFVGVNHHWKNTYFGCAFLQDETTGTFVWLFETFLEAMGGKAPKTIFTDQDQAMAKAIQQVFPTSCHRLCTWHIGKNATQHIGHLYAKESFKQKFNYLLKCCKLEWEFEEKWKALVEEWGVSENKWLKKLYELREKWSPSFNRDTFSANIRSTQRSESTNNVFHLISGKTLTLIEFVHHYEDNLVKMREAENQDDYNNKRGTPQIPVSGNGIFKNASEVYTLRIFNMFADEFLQSMSLRFLELNSEGMMRKFKVHGREGSIEYDVHFDASDLSITCTCRNFEAMGLLCHHALCILNLFADTNTILRQYILKRWTKDAKKGISPERKQKAIQKLSRVLRFNNLMRRAYTVMGLYSRSGEMTRAALEKIDQMEDEAQQMDMNGNEGTIHVEEGTEENPSHDVTPILDPLKKWPKGVSRKRQKSALEMKRKKIQKEAAPYQVTNPNNCVTGQNMQGKLIGSAITTPFNFWHGHSSEMHSWNLNQMSKDMAHPMFSYESPSYSNVGHDKL